MNNKYILKNNLAAFRKLHNLTQSDLADLLRVSKNCISDYERGKYAPSALYVALLCRIFNCKTIDLFYLEEQYEIKKEK